MPSRQMPRGWNTASLPAWGGEGGELAGEQECRGEEGDEEGADSVPVDAS